MTVIDIRRTTSTNADFQKLVHHLDAYLAIVDGDDHAFYAQFNTSETIKNVVVAFDNNIAVGIGAFREIDRKTIEIKRMFTLADHRNKQIASQILTDLERWAQEENYCSAILETGILQHEAISFYLKQGYQIMENYGQYQGVETSICMKKQFFQH